ncbi:hypothetical protein DE146DRAFT_631451 [Phaeosphaeria sp. MPI-PUGE-AT-0046c]|nr:hypothetical protein DE146DRAFT_631451 [Phaeosphaeria sp. MPI-PUGE-AT-0046c]
MAVIFGFQLTAFIFALGHYLLYDNLNGSPLDTESLSQSEVSSLALLLVTLFKASLTASVGSCFAQHLWLILRGRATSISLVEKLFVLRSNALALGDPRAIRRAPILFLMALYVWCIGIAMIYPPGSLIVVLVPYLSTNDREVLMMNPSPSTTFDATMFDREEPWPTLAKLAWAISPNISEGGDTMVSFQFRGARPALSNIARSVMMGDRMLSSPSYTGDNSSYHLRFRAPQYRCNKTTSKEQYLETTNGTLYFEVPAFASRWSRLGNSLVFQKFAVDHVYASSPNVNETQNVTVTVEGFECRGESRMVDLGISYSPKGLEMKRTMTDTQKLGSIPMVWSNRTTIPPKWDRNTSSFDEKFRNWTQSVAASLSEMNQMALLDALGFWMTANVPQKCTSAANRTCTGQDRATNGTAITVCDPKCDVLASGFPLQGTTLHTGRFDNHISIDTSQPFRGESASAIQFHPVRDINPTEELLNELLYNITISSLALGTWKHKVPVTTTSYRNTYRFSHRKNLILPYSISLGVAILFGAIAVWSLHQNGVPAADGGFLQVMMATRGKTEMERLALREGVKAGNDISRELGSLKVRYGQLVDTEGREGFGAVDETLALRKRK